MAQVDGDHTQADEIDAPVVGFNTSIPNFEEPNRSAIGTYPVSQTCVGLIINGHVTGKEHEHVQSPVKHLHTHRHTTHWIYSCGTLADARSDVALHLKVGFAKL